MSDQEDNPFARMDSNQMEVDSTIASHPLTFLDALGLNGGIEEDGMTDRTDSRPSGLLNHARRYRNESPTGVPRLDARLTKLVKKDDDPFYKIKGTSLKGRAVVVNIKSFTGDHETRSGSDNDVVNMLGAMEHLGFTVEVYENLKLRDFAQLVKNITRDPKKSNNEYDMFAMVVLSHGSQNFKEQDVIMSHDSHEIPFKDVLAQFTGNVASTLAGKPKLFFIQACRGSKTDSGAQIVADAMDSSGGGGDGEIIESEDMTDFSWVRTISIPAEADIFVAYSTPPGYYSWRSPDSGSYFMQLLSYHLYNARDNRNDLNKVITLVANDLVSFQSNVPNNELMHMKKQVPWVSSTLTKRVSFVKDLNLI